jgi:hypothetical protein
VILSLSGNVDIFPLISLSDIIIINQLTCNTEKYWSAYDVKNIIVLPIKTVTSVYNVSLRY